MQSDAPIADATDFSRVLHVSYIRRQTFLARLYLLENFGQVTWTVGQWRRGQLITTFVKSTCLSDQQCMHHACYELVGF